MTATVLFLFYFHANEFLNSPSDLKENCLSSQSKTVTEDRVRAWAGIWPLLLHSGGDGPYGESPPERGIFFRPQVYEGVWISLVEVYKRVRKSLIWVCMKGPKRANR